MKTTLFWIILLGITSTTAETKTEKKPSGINFNAIPKTALLNNSGMDIISATYSMYFIQSAARFVQTMQLPPNFNMYINYNPVC